MTQQEYREEARQCEIRLAEERRKPTVDQTIVEFWEAKRKACFSAPEYVAEINRQIAFEVDRKRKLFAAKTAKRVVPAFERELMTELLELIGPEAMAQSGACWRTYITGNKTHPPRPGKVRRVIEWLHEDQQHGKKPNTTWGRMALDYYKQLADWPSDRKP